MQEVRSRRNVRCFTDALGKGTCSDASPLFSMHLHQRSREQRTRSGALLQIILWFILHQQHWTFGFRRHNFLNNPKTVVFAITSSKYSFWGHSISYCFFKSNPKTASFSSKLVEPFTTSSIENGYGWQGWKWDEHHPSVHRTKGVQVLNGISRIWIQICIICSVINSGYSVEYLICL